MGVDIVAGEVCFAEERQTAHGGLPLQSGIWHESRFGLARLFATLELINDLRMGEFLNSTEARFLSHPFILRSLQGLRNFAFAR